MHFSFPARVTVKQPYKGATIGDVFVHARCPGSWEYVCAEGKNPFRTALQRVSEYEVRRYWNIFFAEGA